MWIKYSEKTYSFHPFSIKFKNVGTDHILLHMCMKKIISMLDNHKELVTESRGIYVYRCSEHWRYLKHKWLCFLVTCLIQSMQKFNSMCSATKQCLYGKTACVYSLYRHKGKMQMLFRTEYFIHSSFNNTFSVAQTI